MTEYYSLKAGISKFLTVSGIASRVYPEGEVPQNPSYPFVVFDIIDEVPFAENHNSAPKRQARIQLDIFSESFTEAEELFEKFFNLVSNYKGSLAYPEFPDVIIRYERTNYDKSSDNEPTMKGIKGRSMDFMITY